MLPGSSLPPTLSTYDQTIPTAIPVFAHTYEDFAHSLTITPLWNWGLGLGWTFRWRPQTFSIIHMRQTIETYENIDSVRRSCTGSLRYLRHPQ